MECSTRNTLVLCYLRCQAAKAEAEAAIRASRDNATWQRILENTREEITERRQALLDHCDQHGC